jgi:intracellular sulfur oxidation DsrE/DsrF family protein
MDAAAPAAAQSSSPREKVAYHRNQAGGEGFAYCHQFLVNVSNHLTVLTQGQFDVRIVMHGPGVNLLRIAAKHDPQIAASIDQLTLAGVRFAICRITLRSNNIRREELYDARPRSLARIPAPRDQNPCAHARKSVDMMRHSWSVRHFPWWQPCSTRSS